MACSGRSFFYLLIAVAVALFTYNVIISSTAIFHAPGLPGRDAPSFQESSSDPVVRMPLDCRTRAELRPFHTAVTVSDSVYTAWQCRVMYYWFKKARAARPDSEMRGFTRILDSGRPDSLVDEIPTFVADPFPAGMDEVI